VNSRNVWVFYFCIFSNKLDLLEANTGSEPYPNGAPLGDLSDNRLKASLVCAKKNCHDKRSSLPLRGISGAFVGLATGRCPFQYN
jgi:hypothetical protein